MARTKKQIIKDAERIIEVSNEMSVHKLLRYCYCNWAVY